MKNFKYTLLLLLIINYPVMADDTCTASAPTGAYRNVMIQGQRYEKQLISPFLFNACIEIVSNTVNHHEKWGAVKNGKLIIPLIYDRLGFFNAKGLAIAEKSNDDKKPWLTKVGYIDITNKIIVPLIYDWASALNWDGDLVAVGKLTANGEKMGIYDFQGKLILPVEYDSLEPKGNIIVVTEGDKIFYIDKKGNVIKPS